MPNVTRNKPDDLKALSFPTLNYLEIAQYCLSTFLSSKVGKNPNNDLTVFPKSLALLLKTITVLTAEILDFGATEKEERKEKLVIILTRAQTQTLINLKQTK